ncbi:MAG: hypothetical protein WCM93_14965, partial [Bacteroidota bacterium]
MDSIAGSNSLYTWKIDGTTWQTGYIDLFTHTWAVAATYHLEVQEKSAEGCLGPVKWGEVYVHPIITPTFAPVGPFCLNAVAPALTPNSLNGINGSWSPATITTAVVGTSTYTFTPDAGQCAGTATIEITITPSSTVEFTESACDSYT